MIAISYKSLSPNQTLEKVADLTSWTLNHTKTDKKHTKLLQREINKILNKLETKLASKFLSINQSRKIEILVTKKDINS